MSINGLALAKYPKLDFLPNTTKIFKDFMDVREELIFSNKSTAMLYETGPNRKAIAIVPVFNPKSVVKDGDTLQTTVKPGLTELINRQIEPLQIKIESMLATADSLFSGVSNVR